MKSVCFVVMPFGIKETGAPPPAPATVDFDALWNDAIKPALEGLNYRAVRADEERGALIIHEMIERLYYSDLVIADVSIANANVYYEVGLRHAARNTGCVLIGADWAKTVFDIAQMRRLTYAHPNARLNKPEAAAVIAVLSSIPEKARGTTPPPEIIAGLMEPVVPPGQRSRSAILAAQLEDFDVMYAEMRAIRALSPGDRGAAAQAWLLEHPAGTVTTPYVAAATIPFVRDLLSWRDTLAYIAALPAAVRAHSFVREQEALARAKGGNHQDAIRILEELILREGSTPEREGLLGGRFKKLYYAEKSNDAQAARQHLTSAIKRYEAGMRLDLNQYYCSSNLPSLYRERSGKGDESRAVSAATVARAACLRVVELGLPDDGFLRQTLLGLAFAERNPTAAEDLLERITDEGAVAWQLDSTLADLKSQLAQIERAAPDLAPGFLAIVRELEKLM